MVTPVWEPFGESLDPLKCIGIDLAAVIGDIAQKNTALGAEGASDISGALFPRRALPTFQNPLKGVRKPYPPITIEIDVGRGRRIGGWPKRSDLSHGRHSHSPASGP